ncbi:MAG: hypothetical protein WCS75_03075 [Sphingomonas sp.]
MLYELVQHLKGWVSLFEHLPDQSPHRNFPERERFPGTIPHAAALALGSVLATVVNSQRIDPGVIETLHEVTIRAIRDLHDDGGEIGRMRRYLVDALLGGGHSDADIGYWNRLAALLGTADDILQHEIDDYHQALELRLHPPDAA